MLTFKHIVIVVWDSLGQPVSYNWYFNICFRSQDLGEPLAGHTVNADVFYDNYLAHLSKDPSHNLIVFLQDEVCRMGLFSIW